MITYNHEKYIKTAIESVLNQITSYNILLIIGEDFSTDKTREICLEYKNKYPDKIKLILHDKNIGAANNGKSVYDASIECGAKYLAPLEGDDYWVDPYKIQKQVDFLEQNHEYVGCFHNTEERYENSDISSKLYCNFATAKSIKFSDLCKANLIPTCSLVFRSEHLASLHLDNFRIECGDWALNLYNSQFGCFWYIPHVMGVHRLNETSLWALQDQKKNENKVLYAYDEFIKIYKNDPEKVFLLRKAKKIFILNLKYKHLFIFYRFIKTLFFNK
jgi:glycosyltransferase involved in cell wall biosynthesis